MTRYKTPAEGTAKHGHHHSRRPDRKVARKNPTRTVWRWVTIVMAVVVGYNVVKAISLYQPDRRADVCSEVSEFGCDIAIGTATAINIAFAVGGMLIGVIALIVWRTRDHYRELVEPIPETEGTPKPSNPAPWRVVAYYLVYVAILWRSLSFPDRRLYALSLDATEPRGNGFRPTPTPSYRRGIVNDWRRE